MLALAPRCSLLTRVWHALGLSSNPCITPGRRQWAVLVALLLASAAATAQEPALGRLAVAPIPGLIGAEIGDIRWSGRYLWVATESGLARLEPGRASGLLESDWVTFDARHGLARGSISALDARGDEVWASALYDTSIAGLDSPPPVGSGISVSRDGGMTWTTVPNRTIFDVSRPEFARGPTTAIQNPCYGLSVTGDTVWAAFWAGSTVRSRDSGLTWDRVLPDGARQIVYFAKDTAADSMRAVADSLTRAGAGADRIAAALAAADSLARQESLHRTFEVLAYGDTVWVGTASGIARSFDGGRTWRNARALFQADGSRVATALPADWVVTLERQITADGASVVWAGCRAKGTGESSATAYTRDQGQTWVTCPAPAAWGLAFSDTRIWLTSDDGLYASTDQGASWQAVTVRDEASRETLRGAAVGIARALGILWVGAENGLGRSADDGQTWQIVRTPVTPLTLDTGHALGNPAMVDSVQTYAAPNPFSPAKGESGRIHYSLSQGSRVTVRIYDFASRPVRTLVRDAWREGGQVHGENWDGYDDDGDRVANGVYFFRVELDSGRQAFGKVVVLD